MKFRTYAALGLGSLLLAGQPALAAAPVGDPLAGLQSMRELNAIVLGNTQGWLRVEGKTFVSGNVTGGGTFGVGNNTRDAAASDRATLTVGGNISAYTDLQNGNNGTNGHVGNPASLLVGGNASNLNLGVAGSVGKIGGTLSETAGSNGTVIESGGAGSGWLGANGGTITTGKGAGFSAPLVAGISAESAKLDADLKALSQSLAGMSATSGNSVTNLYGALTLNAVNDGSGVSVFTLNEAALNAWQFTLNVADPTLTVIFNITGDGNYNWNSSLAGALNAGFAGNVIWNFADATALNINQSVYGSILAPLAQINANSLLTGSVVGAGLKANSGVGLGTYDGGDLGFGADAVPEPGTWAMMILGFGLVGAAMRRRERIVRTTA